MKRLDNHYLGKKDAKLVTSNVITRFAYSTREGFSVNNANKKNQDNFILAPNMCQTYHQHFFSVLDGHGQNGTQSSLLVKSKLANFVADHINSGKEQQKVLSEPDPEEKDEVHQEQAQAKEETLVSDALYNSIIKSQMDLEQNGQFNV